MKSITVVFVWHSWKWQHCRLVFCWKKNKPPLSLLHLWVMAAFYPLSLLWSVIFLLPNFQHSILHNYWTKDCIEMPMVLWKKTSQCCPILQQKIYYRWLWRIRILDKLRVVLLFPHPVYDLWSSFKVVYQASQSFLLCFLQLWALYGGIWTVSNIGRLKEEFSKKNMLSDYKMHF